MSEFTNDSVSFTYEAETSEEQKTHIDQTIARAIALQHKMGFDESKGMGFSLYYQGWPSSAVMYAEDEGTFKIHLVPMDSEGWRPALGFAQNIKYSQDTGSVESATTSTYPLNNINKEEEEQRLPAEAVDLFDSFLNESIYSHWKFLNEKRSPEQLAKVEAQLEEAKVICEDLLTVSPWEEKDSPILSRKERFRRFQQNEADIRQTQYGNLVNPQRTFMQRLLKIELPKSLVWEERTWIEAQLGEIHLSVLDTTTPDFSVFSDKHEFEAENFDDPNQLHIESDLVERLRKLKEDRTE